MKLKELKTTDFQEKQKYDFIFPIGSTEQHGLFIPLGTDTYITDYIIENAMKEYPEIIILPTLEYSRAQEHRGFFGTIYLSEETLEKILFDVCNSLQDKARNIFISSFHANANVINRFIKRNQFKNVNLINLEMLNEDDDKKIEEILGGLLMGMLGIQKFQICLLSMRI